MSEFCKLYGLKSDISVTEEERLYGAKWIEFIRAGKVCLASEGGASIWDFDGKIQRSVQKYLKLKPKATFEEVSERFFKKRGK